MADETVQYELRDEVALITLDDGKANALSPEKIDALHAALDRAVGEAKAVVLVGRPGRFSAGFDLSVMGQGAEALQGLVAAGARLAFRLYELQVPVVLACSGHALAMGAILLLAGDTRLGAAGSYRIGMNEVAIGMTLPRFAIGLAQERLSKRHLARATTLAEIYEPEGAVDAGYLDRLVPAEALVDEAVAEAARLAALPGAAHHGTKLRMRAEALERMRAGLDDDMKSLETPRAG